MTMTLETGEKIDIPTGGTMKDTLYSQSFTVVDDEDPEDAKQAVLSGDGNFVDPQGKELPKPGNKRLARRFVS